MDGERDLDPITDIMVKVVFVIIAIKLLAPTFQHMLSGTPTAQMLQAQAYVGLTDNRTLNATPTDKWLNFISDPPYTPWISASFFNDGPHSAFIGINNPDELTEVAVGEGIEVDMTGASRRIEFIFYKCNIGEKASVRVIGKY